MARNLSIPLSFSSASFESPQSPLRPRPFAALAVPLAGSLLQTYGAVWLLCRQPWPSSLTWLGLFRTAAFFLLVTLLAHLFAVWFNRRLVYDDVNAPFKLLAFAIWPSVVWLPLFVLFVRERSFWAALVLPVIASTSFFSLKRWFFPGRVLATPPAAHESIFTIFHSQPSQSLLRRLAPALAVSIALQGAIAEIVLDRPIFAGSLFAACTLLPIWVTPRGLQPFSNDLPTSTSVRLVAPRTLIAFICMAIALIPYLRTPILARALQDLLGAHLSGPPSPAPAQSHAGLRAPGYVGIILTVPPRKQPRVVPEPPIPVHATAQSRKPTVIPFDGQYWFFQQPYDRPGLGAPVVQGSPLRRTIRSTDTQALSMEAHQHLAAPVRTDCCRTLRLTLQNAESAPGPIAVEVLLENTAVRNRSTLHPAAISLGLKVIPSSERPHSPAANPAAHPSDETLNFLIPQHMHLRQFNEITVAIKPPPYRARKAPHIAIQSFELTP